MSEAPEGVIIAYVLEIQDSPSPEPVEEFLFRDNGEHPSANTLIGEAIEIDSPRADTADIDEVDDKEGSLQERATRLIGDILRLRSLDAWPALATVVARPRSPSPPPLLDTVSTTYTTLQGLICLKGGIQALYFVGIQTLTGCRTFCESRGFSDPYPQDGALFLRLQNSGGPLSRALAGLTDRSSYFAGTSDFPNNIAGNYANYQFKFREVNNLLELENSYAMSNVFFPAPVSVMRSELLRTQGQPDGVAVYVLYVYHRNIDPFATHAVPPSNGAFEATTPNDVQVYLRQRFAVQLEELCIWRARNYGSAYHHCLIERQVLRICQALGIGMLGRVHAPAVVGALSIRLEDVVSAAGVNFQTFATYRTEFQRIREAHAILRQRHHNRTLSPDHEPLFRILNVMMAERVLDTACTPGAPGTAVDEMEGLAVRCQITTLMSSKNINTYISFIDAEGGTNGETVIKIDGTTKEERELQDVRIAIDIAAVIAV
ncbi:hypothetical protein B0H14DRAFT_2655106 [Mycena olivaceomarginata]|nr:hypothetical protein B0H14DRAFT_2655106 [Mycena olivaceomarginata]